MKRILFYINLIDCGGAERVITNLANYFSEEDYEVTLLTTYKRENEFQLSEKVNRKIVYSEECRKNRISKNLFQIKYIRNLCKKLNIDVLVAFMYEPSIRAILATRGLKIRTIVSVRDNPRVTLANLCKAFGIKRLFDMAEGCVFQTEDAKSFFGKKVQRKSAVICNMVKDEFYKSVDDIQPQYIITCGRLSKVKNHSMLIHAYATMNIKNKPKLIIYGEGEEHQNLENLINMLNLQGQIVLGGYVRDIRSVLLNARLFVLSSDSEGMPNALMEAMAMGIPCISTDCPCGGPRELFGGELSDLLVPVGDVKLLASKIQELLMYEDIDSLRLKLIKRAEQFKPSNIIDKWEKYILQV